MSAALRLTTWTGPEAMDGQPAEPTIAVPASLLARLLESAMGTRGVVLNEILVQACGPAPRDVAVVDRKALASARGVGPSNVAHALSRLVAEGVVESVPGGYRLAEDASTDRSGCESAFTPKSPKVNGDSRRINGDVNGGSRKVNADSQKVNDGSLGRVNADSQKVNADSSKVNGGSRKVNLHSLSASPPTPPCNKSFVVDAVTTTSDARPARTPRLGIDEDELASLTFAVLESDWPEAEAHVARLVRLAGGGPDGAARVRRALAEPRGDASCNGMAVLTSMVKDWAAQNLVPGEAKSPTRSPADLQADRKAALLAEMRRKRDEAKADAEGGAR